MTSTKNNDPYIGKHIGNYHILRLLGQGNSSDIYLGEHDYFHTQAAIKVLDQRHSQQEIAKFLAQASVVIHLQHPNILHVQDFGMVGEIAYLVMDYAPYGTLRQRHPKGSQLPLPTVVPYVQQVAAALDYIHQHNLIHRDIKPHNMLIGAQREILLGDFGIALVSENCDGPDSPIYDFEGTVLYAAPEQLQGMPRKSSDQYALGIVTYEWLTGSPPFIGTFDDVVQQHLFSPPPLLEEYGVQLPAGLDEILQRALAKEPEARYPNVQEFAQALQRIAQRDSSGKGSGQREVPRKQFRSPFSFSDER